MRTLSKCLLLTNFVAAATLLGAERAPDERIQSAALAFREIMSTPEKGFRETCSRNPSVL